MSQLGQFSPQARVEQVIAVARLALAGGSLLALAIGPSVPARFGDLTRGLAVGYTLWAIIVLLVSRSTLLHRGWPVSTHAVDLLVCLLFMSLTPGAESPFFIYLVFALTSATLRWDAPGTLWTGGAALAVFFGAVLIESLRGVALEANILIIRATYLIVLALMLAYVGQYGAHVRAILQKLPTWQPAVRGEMGGLMEEAVRHFADVVEAPRVVFVWEEAEEPDVRLIWWADGRISAARMEATSLQPLVLAGFEGVDFLCRDPSGPHPTVVLASPSGLQTTPGPAVNPRFIELFGIGTLIAVACGPGRLFVVDKPQLTVDDLWLTQILAHQVSASLDQASLARRLEEARVVEARGRVARDLHDGVLQSLTAITLRLQTLARAADDHTRRRIERLQTTIGDEARRLRSFIQDLSSLAPETVPDTLADRLDMLKQQVERDWDLHVELDGRDLTRIPTELTHDVYFVVREALINVARHAAASTAHATIAVEGAQLNVTVRDDGRGFPFEGRYEGTALVAMNRAPRMLYERVTSLEGRLVVDSGPGGARLDIEIPLPEGRTV